MNSQNVSALRDAADHLSVLAGIFEIPTSQLKANSIRKADKSLVTLESCFTETMAQSAGQWTRAYKALQVLETRFKNYQSKDAELEAAQAKRKTHEDRLSKWILLTDTERNRIGQHAKTARHFLEQKLYNAESYVIHRFQRFEALRSLSPYADNAEYLCEAIHHYENRQKYEEHLVRLEKKKADALIRLKTVKRGFLLAMIFCLLIVTIPLCLPFAFSIWGRKREIEQQIANIDETTRREERRLTAADEGVIASQEIREVLGDVSLEHVRQTLAELKELRTEFQGPQQSPSVTATLLTFLDLYKPRLNELFGIIPSDPVESFRWLERKVSDTLEDEKRVAEFKTLTEKLLEEKKSVTKGHSIAILKDSMNNLEHAKNSSLEIAIPEEFKPEFAEICKEMPALLAHTRECLRYFCNGYSVTESQWKDLQRRLKSFSNTLSACILSLEIGLIWSNSEESISEVRKIALP